MPKRPSNTYASQGPSQRRRRSPSAASDLDSDDEAYQEPSANGSGSAGGIAEGNANGDDSQEAKGGLNNAEVKAKAGQLVRFALFQEYKRISIRRSDIIKNVLSKTPRAYNVVFARAQSILRLTMGCELHEVRQKGKGEVVRLANISRGDGDFTQSQTQTQTQAQTQAQKKKGKGRARLDDIDEEEEDDDVDGEDGAEGGTSTQRKKGAGSKTYILRSTLPIQLQQALSNPQPLPYDVDNDDEANGNGAGDGNKDSGALINWEKGDGSSHIGLNGIRTIILAIIMCSGRVMSDDNLHALLRRLNLKRETPLPYTSSDTHSRDAPQLITLDKYLEVLVRQQYLEKVKLPGAAGNPESGSVEWRWGNREAEMSEVEMAQFIQDIMLGEDDDEDEEPQSQRRRRNGEEVVEETRAMKKKKLMDDIVRAAGGPLVGAN